MNQTVDTYSVSRNRMIDDTGCDVVIEGKNLNDILTDYGREIILKLLLENNNITRVAGILGMKRQSFQHRIKKCKITIVSKCE